MKQFKSVFVTKHDAGEARRNFFDEMSTQVLPKDIERSRSHKIKSKTYLLV